MSSRKQLDRPSRHSSTKKRAAHRGKWLALVGAGASEVLFHVLGANASTGVFLVLHIVGTWSTNEMLLVAAAVLGLGLLVTIVVLLVYILERLQED